MGNLFLTKLKTSQVKSSQVKPVVKGLIKFNKWEREGEKCFWN